MYNLVYDRIFWIYFIVALFFAILGVGYIITSIDDHMLIIMVLWLLSIVLLLIIVYHASIYWSPGPVCVVDGNSQCFEPSNRIWLLINIGFVVLLILSTLWAAELSNLDAGPLRPLSGVLILLGGLVLCSLSTYLTADIPFWSCVAYLFIWFGLAMYITLT